MNRHKKKHELQLRWSIGDLTQQNKLNDGRVHCKAGDQWIEAHANVATNSPAEPAGSLPPPWACPRLTPNPPTTGGMVSGVVVKGVRARGHHGSPAHLDPEGPRAAQGGQPHGPGVRRHRPPVDQPGGGGQRSGTSLGDV